MKHIYLIPVILSSIILPSEASAKGGISEEELNFDRGVEQKSTVFVPRGTFAFGATVKYHSYACGNGQS